MYLLGRRSNISVSIAFILCMVIYASRSPSFPYLGSKTFNNPAHPEELIRHVCRHVAVATTVDWHFDIYMNVAGTVEKELAASSCGDSDVRVYRPSPFRYKFEQMVAELGPFHGQFFGQEELITDLNSTTLYPEDTESPMIDLLILGTCEWDLQHQYHQLLQSWEARPADKKFQIVCYMHHGDDIDWHDHLVEWVRRGAIRILTFSEHVSRRLQRNFRALAESYDETFNSAGYEYVKMDVFFPVLNLPQTRVHTSVRSLSDVSIQGSFRFERRDYHRVYADLLISLEEDPRDWGYLPLTQLDSVYEMDTTAPLPPFRLHLVGDSGDPQVPRALANIVQVHQNLDYDNFYSLIQSMDLAIPAWATLDYFEARASFTTAIAIECNVPILVNQWMLEANALDDRVTVIRPQAVHEIFAVKALRTGKWSPRPAVGHQVKEVARDVEKMIEKGWIRSADQFATFKGEVWAQNRDAVQRILNDV